MAPKEEVFLFLDNGTQRRSFFFFFSSSLFFFFFPLFLSSASCSLEIDADRRLISYGSLIGWLVIMQVWFYQLFVLREIASSKFSKNSELTRGLNFQLTFETSKGKRTNLSMARENSRVKMRFPVENAPRDILFSILGRLPLKSVLRFCCVSKYWFSVIMDPDFKNLHLFQSPTEPTVLILSQRKLSRENVISMSHLNLKDHKVHVSDSAISHMVGSHSFNLVGTCNGLLCFTSFNQGESVCVGNPITRELVTLPKPSRIASAEPHTLVYGFGFDCLTKKYKVVRIFHPTISIPDSFRFGNLETHMTAEVYTLGAAGSWKAVQGFDRPPFGQPVFANGAVHWVVHPRFVLGWEGDKIISFDISKDEFTSTPHPKFGSTFSIAELGGCLSVVADIMSSLIKVWVRKDHVTNHWEQEYIVPINSPSFLDQRFPRLISICEQNGVLLIWLQDGLYSYECRTFRRKMLKISGFPTWLDWEVCSGFRGSLVPPGFYCDNGGGKRDAAYFVSDMELYSRPVSTLVCEHENVGRSQALVTCFTKNRMLVD